MDNSALPEEVQTHLVLLNDAPAGDETRNNLKG